MEGIAIFQEMLLYYKKLLPKKFLVKGKEKNY